jgi:peptidyl-prolyl cis-trans isomerase SurA
MHKFTPVFFLTLLLAYPVYSEARLIDKTVALVNNDVILQSDLGSFNKNLTLRKEIDPFMSLTGFSGTSPKDILDYLVQEQLILQKSAVTEDEIEEEVTNVQRNNKIDRDHLKEVLKAQGVDFEDYKKLMRVSVSKRKLVEKELRPLSVVTDDEVKSYYYTDPSFQDTRKSQKLVLSFTLQQMIVPSQTILELAQKRLKSGEDFDTIASDLSGRGVENSRLGTISEENLSGKIREAVQGLKVGETTKPIAAGSGYMILKILDVSAPKDSSFEKEKERIRGFLFQKALLNQLRLWSERERNSSYIHIP